MRGIGAKKFLFSIMILFVIIIFSLPVQAQFVQKWAVFYDGSKNLDDMILDIETGPSGNVYVTGGINDAISGGRLLMATAAYDEFGTMLWLREGEKYRWGLDIAVDQYDNAYVAGSTGIIKFDRYGNEIWNARDTRLWQTERVRVDIHGNVYTIGSNGNYVIVKFDNNGHLLWRAEYDGIAHGNDRVRDIVVDNPGNVYVTGDSPVSSSNKHIVTLKYDVWGNKLWETHYDDPDVGNVTTEKMVLDGPRLFIISQIGQNYTTIAYDTDGNFDWARGYDGPGYGSDYPRDVAVDAIGNVYVTGKSWGKDSEYDYATIAYDEWGNKRWEERFDGYGHGSDEAKAITCDRTTGFIFVTGYCRDFDGTADIVTLAYNTHGVETGRAVFDGPRAGSDIGRAITSDTEGNIYVGGSSHTDSTYFSDFVVVKYSFLSGPTLPKPFYKKTIWPSK